MAGAWRRGPESGRVPVAWGSRPARQGSIGRAGEATVTDRTVRHAVVPDAVGAAVRQPRSGERRGSPRADTGRTTPTTRPRRSSSVRVARTVATGQPGDRDELVDRRPPADELARRSGAAVPPSSAQRRAASRVAARAAGAVGQPEVLDELRDARRRSGHSPGTRAGTRGSRRAAGASIEPGHEEAVATLLERPRRRDAGRRCAPAPRRRPWRRPGR